MKYKISSAFFILYLAGVVNFYGQRSVSPPIEPNSTVPEWVRRNAEKRAEMERLEKKGEIDWGETARDPRLERNAREKRQIRSEEKKRIEAILKPNPDDAVKYGEFLKKPGTGLVRLIPDFGCLSTFKVIYVEGDCAGSVPYGWNYSFRLTGYPNGISWGDIRLEGENLVSDGFLTQAVLVSLGNVSIENLSASSDGMRFLTDFSPAVQFSKAKRQRAKIGAGIVSENYTYSNSVKYEENITYALRITAYRSDREPKTFRTANGIFMKDDPRYSGLKHDKRIDLVVGFRVIRKEENGGITILWKEISSGKAPKLMIPAKDNLTDLKK